VPEMMADVILGVDPLQGAAVSINVPKDWENKQREGSPVRDVG
jgi:hypothetical protein